MFVNGGHNPFYKVSTDSKVTKIGPTGGIPVSFLPDFQYQTTITHLEPGDTLFLFTDGVTEAMDENENEFTEARLEKCLADIRPNNPKMLIEGVFQSIAEFTRGVDQSDDITVFAIQYKP